MAFCAQRRSETTGAPYITAITVTCYHRCMTKLLKQAMERLSQLPPAAQDSAARVLISQLEEEPEPGDREAIEAGREAFGRGDFTTLHEWRREMGLRDR